ncbi:hypothetical protein [Nocardia jejuensis]|uniref:hypothetical protein n=1 Tax=Nocardia jejuensis TaxID=328049 RepID=UPI000832A8E7|nr:hypothetical protein [Nocardia jejuensis]
MTTVREQVEKAVALGADAVYSAPYETADGTTIVTAYSAGGWFGGPRVIGVFAVKDGQVRYEAAIDGSRIATIGVLTGLVAAALSTLAVLRRPPWPDLRITQNL